MCSILDSQSIEFVAPDFAASVSRVCPVVARIRSISEQSDINKRQDDSSEFVGVAFVSVEKAT